MTPRIFVTFQVFHICITNIPYTQEIKCEKAVKWASFFGVRQNWSLNINFFM